MEKLIILCDVNVWVGDWVEEVVLVRKQNGRAVIGIKSQGKLKTIKIYACVVSYTIHLFSLRQNSL